jgi:glycolate oxidase FAD binding subunit
MAASESPAVPQAVERLLGSNLVISAPEGLAAFRLDGLRPAAAVFPEQPEQAAELLALAAEQRWGVVPWGGGHGIAAGQPPARYDVALSLSRLERVVDHDTENLTLTAEGGMALAEANRQAGAAHQLLPLGMPAERNTLGGIVAAARPVPKRLLYGDVRDLLIGIRVALPDGSLVRYGRKVIKNVAGYDMNKLFLGSQGMLGVIVETTFKLFPLPDEERYVLGFFPDAAAGARAAAELLASPLLPACLFLLDERSARAFCVRERLPEPGGPAALLAAFEGRAVALARQVRAAREIMANHGSEPAEPLATLTEGAGNFLRAADSDTADAGLPVRLRIGATQTELAGLLAELGPSLGGLGLKSRAGADFAGGVVHLAVAWPGDEAAQPLAEWIAARRAALEPLRGSVVVEAAPVPLKRLCHVWGDLGGEMEIMRLIKGRFDPHGIMVPGRYLELE